VDSAEVYRGQSFGPIYLCRPCQAWVGCHKGTTNSLGRLANRELRAAKQQTHAMFDPLWVRGSKRNAARRNAYRWLAKQLQISEELCHIGLFDLSDCTRAIAVIAHAKRTGTLPSFDKQKVMAAGAA
jgi:hypothetical protein